MSSHQRLVVVGALGHENLLRYYRIVDSNNPLTWGGTAALPPVDVAYEHPARQIYSEPKSRRA
jgi:hypothetical protein